jgi:uncharacterized protein (DUF1800 family)
MPTSLNDVCHLHRRAGFGISLAAATQLTGHTRAELVAALMDRSGEPADIRPGVLSDAGVSGWEHWVAATHAWLDRMATTPHPLVEKMALFWHGHFVSGNDKVNDMALMWDQIQLYREAGTGNFRALAKAMALTPAMLYYLDNHWNRAGTPNDNFARELLELFLLGEGNYAESDVVAAARAWTGHTVDPATRRYTFRADWHDAGVKTFLGRAEALNGPDTIDRVLDHPTLGRVCARFIVRKLWSSFAHPDPPEAVLTDLSDIFVHGGWEIAPVLRAMFLRDEFYAAAATDGLVRSPIEWCVALARIVNLPASELHPDWRLASMGQQPFVPPNVAGWGNNAYWLSTAAAQARADHARYVAWRAGVLRGTFGGTVTMPVEAASASAFDAFGLDRVSAGTQRVVADWLVSQRAVPFTTWEQQMNLFALVAVSAEAQLA